MHQGHDDGLEDDVVVPVVLPIDLLVVDPFRLNLRVLRHRVYPRERYPKLRVHVADGGDHEHVVGPIVGVVHAERGGGHERHEQEVFEAPHVLPRELIPGPGPERHVGLIRRRHVRAPVFFAFRWQGVGACLDRTTATRWTRGRVPATRTSSKHAGIRKCRARANRSRSPRTVRRSVLGRMRGLTCESYPGPPSGYPMWRRRPNRKRDARANSRFV